jgi:hypothetical protein
MTTPRPKRIPRVEGPDTRKPSPSDGNRISSCGAAAPGKAQKPPADFAQDVKRGETRLLSTAITLSNPEYGSSLFDLLRPQSVFLRSGVNTLSTDSDSVIYPTLTADPTLGWVAEAARSRRRIRPSARGPWSRTSSPYWSSTRTRWRKTRPTASRGSCEAPWSPGER